MYDINFSKINDIDDTLKNAKNKIFIRIRDNKMGKITQTPNIVDRCCKPFEKEPDISHKLTIKDDIPRIQCNISKEEFFSEYVQKRKASILLGCQKKWPARKWTFEGIFLFILLFDSSYYFILISYVDCFYRENYLIHIQD